MRDKLNNSPAAQIAIVVVLLLGAGYFVLGGMGGGEEEEAAPTEATVAIEGTSATGTATGATPGEAVEGAVEGAVEAASSELSSSTEISASVPAPALPHPVTAAYEAGKTVVILVVHDGGIDDGIVTKASAGLRSMSEVALFVVPVGQISRYAAITLGVDVNRVPALIVMRPKSLAEGVPQASVSYGFQSPQSVAQAVEDASYNGPVVSYHPE
ncbi:MAG TPA: hypothetical protein VHU86_05990 [Solirubrobacterales bacterium]|jgi:hypothetical protein|nr:hypothetical protein [Solirubrobacterales bacterium]